MSDHDPYYRTWQQCRIKAERYDTMYRALTGQYDWFDRHINAFDPQGTIRRLPKYIPRGRPVEWYREQADAYQQKADRAWEMYHTLHDFQEKTAFERLSRDEKLAVLRQQAERMAGMRETIQEYEAKVVLHEAELARKEIAYEGLPPADRMVREWMDRQNDPQAMVDTFRQWLAEVEEEQRWRLEHL